MTNKTIRILLTVTALLSCTFIFFKWFTISVADIHESHSFMTVPSLLENGAGFITRLGGKSVAAVAIILGGVLKYMCILSAGLGIFGIWKTCIRGEKSRLIFSSGIISIALSFVALVTILAINIIARSIVPGLITVKPMLWIFLSTVFSVISVILTIKYNKENNM